MLRALPQDERFRLVKECSREHWHVTLVTKDEKRSLGLEAVKEAKSMFSGPIYAIGLGMSSSSPSVLFVVCVWPRGRAFRAKHGLPPKDFHITLSVDDAHDIGKGYDSLVGPERVALLEMDALRALSRQLMLETKPQQALQVATILCTKYVLDVGEREWVRLGDAAFASGIFKLAILSYAQALSSVRAKSEHVDAAVVTHCLSRMGLSAKHTEYGLVFADGELGQIPLDLRDRLCRPWSIRLLDVSPRQEEITGSNCLLSPHPTASREQLYTLDWSPLLPKCGIFKLPRFFSWVVAMHLAAMSTPRNHGDVRVLVQTLGIRHIVTLTAESPLKNDWFDGLHCIEHTFLPTDNYHPPSQPQIDIFMRICCSGAEEGNTPVLVHCGGGKGRAGTMLACYLVAFGFNRPPPEILGATDFTPTMNAAEAIQALRTLRPGSLETPEQEAAVHTYCSALWKRRSILPRPVSEPTGTYPVITGKPVGTTDFIVMCGLPGSGKSSFSRALIKRANASVPVGPNSSRKLVQGPWIEVDSDVDGRGGCERSVSSGGSGKRLILDRCNGTREDREWFVKLAASWSSHATAIWFDLPTKICEARAMLRGNHPTLPPGSRVRKAIEQHGKSFTPPELSEGFHSVVRISSVDAALALVDMLSTPLPLMKFPRTPHLIDLGGATEDDIVSIRDNGSGDGSETAAWPEWLVPSGTAIVVTEKLDGANLGISLAPHSRAFVVQNRSHYIASESHRQFQALDGFLAEHRESLFAILNRDPLFPGRFVLYGEWLAATHSVEYTSLQSLFYAFDLYDRETRQFWDRKSLELLLDASGARFPLAPVVFSGPNLPSRPELVKLSRRDSPFCDGIGEGIYLKWERGGVVVDRSKVVRGDFIAGNEHWTKGVLRFNRVAQ